MPGTHRCIEITYPQAEELADLYGILLDLQGAKRLCTHVLELPDLGVAHYEVVDGLIVGALSKYMRCFAGGSRLGLKQSDLSALSENLQRTHDFFKHLRDKHVMHPVNPLEETYVTATASEIDSELLPITSLNPGRHTVLLATGDAEAIYALATAMEEHLKPRIECAKHELLNYLQSLPLEQVHALDLHNPQTQSAETNVKRSRKQARKRGHP